MVGPLPLRVEVEEGRTFVGSGGPLPRIVATVTSGTSPYATCRPKRIQRQGTETAVIGTDLRLST